MLFFFSVSGPRVREDGRDSAHILTLVLLVGAWEADHVINFGGGAWIGLLSLVRFFPLKATVCR